MIFMITTQCVYLKCINFCILKALLMLILKCTFTESKNDTWYFFLFTMVSGHSVVTTVNTVDGRYSGHRTIHWATLLAPKPTVFMKNDINSFCRYPNYNQKLLIRFFTKLVRFLAKPEKRVFMPRPVNNASHQVPSLIREKG